MQNPHCGKTATALSWEQVGGIRRTQQRAKKCAVYVAPLPERKEEGIRKKVTNTHSDAYRTSYRTASARTMPEHK